MAKLTTDSVGFEQQEVDKSQKVGVSAGPEFRDRGIMQILFPPQSANANLNQQQQQQHNYQAQHTTGGFMNSSRIVPSQDLASALLQTTKNASVMNLEVYESAVRDKVIKFCGWLASTMQQKDMRRMPHSQLPNIQTYESVKQLELGVKGGTMRTVVMAALNFDFAQAQGFLSNSDTVGAYNEDTTTIMNFQNLLGQLKELSIEQQLKQNQSQMAKESVQNKIKQLWNLNKNVYKRMKNPYLQLFYLILIESRIESSPKRGQLSKILQDFNKNYAINLFDYVAICCKYLDNKTLKEVLEAKIDSDIRQGNLQVLALTGLKSDRVTRVVQNYIDNTGDVQTAAYVSAYIATVMAGPAFDRLNAQNALPNETSSVSKVLLLAATNTFNQASTHQPEQTISIAKHVKNLRRYIQTYREMLNSLRLWNVRATFDVTWNQLHKKFPMLVISAAAQANLNQSLPGGGMSSSILQMQQQRMRVTPGINNGLTAIGQQNMMHQGIDQQQVIQQISTNQKEDRPEAEVLSDCFSTTAFENQARCGVCPKSFSVQVDIKKFRDELLLHQKNKQRSNANVTFDCTYSCGHPLPSCAVCFRPITVLNAMYEFKKQQTFQNSTLTQKDLNHGMDKWLLWCQTCQHGGHAGHIHQWFNKNQVCPVSSCLCKCFAGPRTRQIQE